MFKRQPKTQPRGRRQYSRTPVTTYYQSQTGRQSDSPFKKKEPPKNRRKIIVGGADIAIILVLLVILVYSLLLSSTPKVSATNFAYHPAADYQAAVRGSLSGVKDHNKITFDEASVISEIQKKFPEVTSARIELPFFSETPNVRLVISPPALKIAAAGGTFVVDSQGVAISRAGNAAGFAGLPLVSDQSGFQAQTGRQVLSSDAVSFIVSLINQCRRAKVPVKALTLPALPQELDLRTADQPYYVKFYLGGDVNLQAGQFLAARHQFAQSHQSPAQYLDVRVAGKIFYK